MFVGILHAPGIVSPHIGKVNLGSRHRLYRLASDFADSFGVGQVALDAFVHPVVVGLVGAVVYLF
jgi:hypothetical protein